jgi:hypothetical protein
MGCTQSKNDISEMEGVGQSDTSNMTPEDMIKELDRLSKAIRDLKEKMRPALAEKTGLNLLLEEKQRELMGLMSTKEEFMKQRAVAMEKCWERDADEVVKAFKSSPTNKETLVKILTNRTKWQVELIAAKYEKKTGKPLLAMVLNDMTTALGSLLTGGNTQLAELLQWRILSQPMRDGALLREFSDGMSLEDENLLEILATRTNAENRAAIKFYHSEYRKNFVDIVKNKSQGTFGSYKNYKDFMMKVLECRRDEDNKPFEPEKAQALAQELFDARSKVIGRDETPFIRIFSTINRVQFESINNFYPGKALITDITKFLGAGLCTAVLAMCADKHEFLAGRLEQALSKYNSADKKTVCRILGCCSRIDCSRIRDAYLEKFKRSLDDDLKNAVKQGNYLQALLNLTSGDTSQTPLGSDKELGEDEADNAREGERQKDFFMRSYKDTKTIERGMAELAKQAKAKRQGVGRAAGPGGFNRTDNPAFDGPSSRAAGAAAGPGMGAASAAAQLFSTADEDDEQLGIHFELPWDPVKGRLWKDKNKLANCLDDYRIVYKDALLACERYADEVKATQEVYLGIVRLCFETEAWHRALSQHIKSLDRFMKNYPIKNKAT